MGDFKTFIQQDSVDGRIESMNPKDIDMGQMDGIPFIYDTVEKILYVPFTIAEADNKEIEYYIFDQQSPDYGKKLVKQNWFSAKDRYKLYQTKYGLVALLKKENGYTVYRCKDKSVIAEIPSGFHETPIYDTNGLVSHFRIMDQTNFYFDVNTLQRNDALPEDKRLNENLRMDYSIALSDARWEIQDRKLVYTSITGVINYPIVPNVQHYGVIIRAIPRYLLVNEGKHIDLYDGRTGNPIVKNGDTVRIPIPNGSRVEGSIHGFIVYTREKITMYDFDGNKLCQLDDVRISCFDVEGEEDALTEIFPQSMIFVENGIFYVLLMYVNVPFMKVAEEYEDEFGDQETEFFSPNDLPMVNIYNPNDIVLLKDLDPERDNLYRELIDRDMLEQDYRTIYTCYIIEA